MGNKSNYPKGLKPESIKTKKIKPAGISEKVIKILKAYTIIANGKYPSARQLAEDLEAAERTVYRYLEIINFVDPIEFDREKNGYKFTHGDRIKKLILSDDAMLALFAMGEAVSHLGAPFRNYFYKLLDQIINGSQKKIAADTVPICIKIQDAVQTQKTEEYFKTIYACIKEQRSIDITYRALYNNEITERRVDPYGLIFNEGAWLLNGYCHLRERIKNFAVDRIMDLKETWLHFQKKEGFDLEARLKHSWGIYDEEDVKVTVRFSKKAAEFITRRDKWHSSEERKILPSGEVELSFTIAGVSEIRRWIYSWFPNVEVIEPAWFREQIRKDMLLTEKKHR